MKKSVLVLCMLFLLMWSNISSLSADEKGGELSRLLAAISKLQAYIEFYYMETGIYPKSLSDLDRIFNEDVEQESDKIVFPKDPATGKSFVYATGKDLLSYKLSVPDPAAYGLESMTISSVNWGWMNFIAQEKRRVAFAQFCKFNIEFIAAAVDKYKGTEKKLPPDLKELIPKYLKSLPGCPAFGKEFIYKVEGENYSITCANSKDHGFKTFRFTSNGGFRVEPIESSQKEVKKETKENKPFK